MNTKRVVEILRTIIKYIIILLFFTLHLNYLSVYAVGIAPPGSAHGTWYGDSSRSEHRLLILKDQEVDEVRTRIQQGDPFFGFLYSNNSSGYKGTRGGIYEHALEDASLMNRTLKAFAAKNKAIVYLIGLDDTFEIFAEPEDREAFKQSALSLLRNFDTSTGGFSGRNKLHQRARELIRIYYNRVFFSNYYFTSSKEGWKTDRGMIYVVYGQPHALYKSTNQEKWIYYNKSKSYTITFIFNKIRGLRIGCHFIINNHWSSCSLS